MIENIGVDTSYLTRNEYGNMMVEINKARMARPEGVGTTMAGLLFVIFVISIIMLIAGGNSISAIGIVITIALGAYTVYSYTQYKRKNAEVDREIENIFRKYEKIAEKRRSQGRPRSKWEIELTNYIRSRFPNCRIEENNRSIIKSRDEFSTYYEIDIYLPDQRLGFEVNGDEFHDKNVYDRDKRRNTENSKEMYKERYCRDHGITLIHLWETDSEDEIYQTIDKAINNAIGYSWY